MPGMVGALPWPAWGTVVSLLSSPESEPYKDWQTTVLELRRTCKALAELVGAGCVGGAKWLKVATPGKSEELEAAATASFGRALVVFVRLPTKPADKEVRARARALALAVDRGHMVGFVAAGDKCTLAVIRMIEAALIEASRKRQLVGAYFYRGESRGWSVDAMAQLSTVDLFGPERDTVPTVMSVGTAHRLSLWEASVTDLSILSSLREVRFHGCPIEDLSPLADVPELGVRRCNVKTLPAMRNNVLEVDSCDWLTDVSGLAGGRVGRLELRYLFGVEDVSAIGAMQAPPRTVILERMDKLQDVSMLAGVRRLELIKCRKIKKVVTRRALEGKVGTIHWRR